MLSEIHYRGHAETAEEVCRIFPGLCPEQLPDGVGWAVEDVRISTHNGTHMDAPWHYHSTMDGGARGTTIDEIPLEWCFPAGRQARLPAPRGRPCRRLLRNRGRAEANRPRAEAPRHRGREHRGRGPLRTGRLAVQGMRLRARGDAVADAARRARGGDRRVVLGRPVPAHRRALGADPRPVNHLGGAQGRPDPRLLPAREARQSRDPPAGRLPGRLLRGQGQERLRRVDSRCRDYRRLASRLSEQLCRVEQDRHGPLVR